MWYGIIILLNLFFLSQFVRPISKIEFFKETSFNAFSFLFLFFFKKIQVFKTILIKFLNKVRDILGILYVNFRKKTLF